MIEPVCTDSSLAADEQLIGSAPQTSAWVCLEQPGPWGPKAFTASHLDPSLGAAIESAASAAGVRPSLIRRTKGSTARSTGRTLLVAYTDPADSWLIAGQLDSPDQVLDLDWAAVAAGDRAAVIASLPLVSTDEPVLLVCTNGTRDTCCARLGRPVAIAAEAAFPGRVWEVTHTSGHRFAPTSVLLPSGYLHGRILDAASVLRAADAGELSLGGLRGRSTWPAEGQVAEELVRRTHAVVGLDDLSVVSDGGEWVVSHRDGRSWRVGVSASVDPETLERAESCGKALKPVVRLRPHMVDEALRGTP